MEIYLIIIFIMSLITFTLYAIDKKSAIKHKWRIKEVTLLTFTFLFGSIGGLLGLYILRHKNKHWYFAIINWLSLIIHIIIAIYVYKWKGFMYL